MFVAFIDWVNLDLNTGHRVIDEQHERLIEIVNDLYKQFLNIEDNSSSCCTSFKNSFYDMKEYVDFHFAEEEKIMTALDYQYKEEHVKAHRDFQGKVNELAKKLNNRNNPNIKYISKKLLLILRDLLLEHITDEDKVFVLDCAHLVQANLASR